MIAWVSLMCDRNLFPKPSPSEAPFTKPAISTNSVVVGITFSGLTISAIFINLWSGTGTTPTFGSIVQKGKFCASIPAAVKALNRVDLPTLGSPTIPHLRLIFLFLMGVEFHNGFFPAIDNQIF